MQQFVCMFVCPDKNATEPRSLFILEFFAA